MKLPKDMITPEEAQKLITSADNARDRAFIHFLWESGCRIGEAINLKMSNLEFHKGECRVNLYGKMGARRILLLECVRDLENYLLVRPDAKPTDPLFVLHGTVNKGKALNHGSVSKLLGELKKRAGVTKNVYAYLFRHSRATYLASQGLSEAQLCLIFGWVLGSKQVATYIHLSGAQVEDAYKKLYGIESVQDQEQKMIKCQICNTVTSAKNDVCLNCHNPLTIQGALKLKQQNDLLEQDRDVSQKVFAEAFKLVIEQKMSLNEAQAEAVRIIAHQQTRKGGDGKV